MIYDTTLAKIPVAINQGYIAMKCNKILSPHYVLQWCHAQMEEIKIRSSGTTFKEISKKNFKTISCLVPSKSVLNVFSNMVDANYSKISDNAKENQNLINLRDTLLPKMLSGEIDVSGIEK